MKAIAHGLHQARRFPLVVGALAIGLLVVGPAVAEAPPVLILKWGRFGVGPGEFFDPYGVAASPLGFIYVADTGNHRVQKFAPDSTFLGAWGRFGSAPGEFGHPGDVTVDPMGSVYVVDANGRVQKFDPNGNLVTSWPGGGQLAADPSGAFIYMSGGGLIAKLTTEGVLVDQWMVGNVASTFGGIGVGVSGDLYVTDDLLNRVLRVNSAGVVIDQWGGVHGEGEYEFDSPIDAAVDSDGNVYVLDNLWVRKFTADGVLLTRWGGVASSAPGQFPSAPSLTVDGDGHVYVCDRGSHRVQKFGDEATPTQRPTWGQLKARYRAGSGR